MNTVTITTALWIAIVCMIIGFVTGGFIGYFNKDKRKTKDVDAPVIPSDQPAPLADPAKYTELVRLWREKDGPGLFVETSGHLLGSSAPLNKNQKSRFIDLIKELAVWLGIDSSELFPVKPISNVSPQVIETVKPTENEMAIPLAQLKASEPVKTNPLPVEFHTPPPPAFATPVVSVQSQVPPVVPVVYASPAPVPPPAIATSEKTKKQPTSMVEQIDEILQDIISRSETPTRHIKLMEEKNEGVIVWVGQEHFVGIDAVTDKSAVDMIRAAAKEWERRTEIRPNGA